MERESDPPTEIILTTQDRHLAQTWSLVLFAVEVPHRIEHRDDCYSLSVPPKLKIRAIYELETYFAENKDWPPKTDDLDEQESGIQPPTLLLVAILCLFYGVTGPWSSESHWFIDGAGNSEAILNQHEYYRLVTALTLHADIVHLMGNCFLGGFLVHFFCRLQGSGLGLFSMLVSSVTGNWLNVYLRGPGHYFVGFSTAVFAVIGMLAMVNHYSQKKRLRFHFFIPIMAGASLLAMVGSSGERTDLGAHLFGLAAGLFIGRLLSLKAIAPLRNSPSLQSVLFLASGFVFYFSWQWALAPVAY